MRGRKWTYVGAQGLALLAIFAMVLIAPDKVSGEGYAVTWREATGAKMTTVNEQHATWKEWYQPHCTPSYEIVEDYSGRQTREVCVVSAQDTKLAVFQSDGGDQVFYALRRDADEHFHRIATQSSSVARLQLLPNNMLLGAAALGLPGLALYSLDDIRTRVGETSIPTGPTTYNKVYSLDMNSAIPFTDAQFETIPVGHIAVSKNMKYAAAQALGRGVIRIDLASRQVKLLSNDTTGQSTNIVAVSNDGDFVAVTGGVDAPHRVYANTARCGSLKASYRLKNGEACPYTVLGNNIDRLPYLHNAEFEGVNFVVRSWDGADEVVRIVTLTPDPSKVRLHYLAMGDSYSSGEGDTGWREDWTSYYLEGTNEWPDTCRISNRSYPFLLKNTWGIPQSSMRSVACSGARVVFDYARPLKGYIGQANRLQDKSNVRELQERALETFTPGRVPQIEFVKKYQPELITLTGGGNDVGFGDVLKYCASPEWYDLTPVVNLFSDCDYAKEGSVLNIALRDTIDTQYEYNKTMINALIDASPHTKIVIVGYPSFIAAESSAPCGLNSGSLTKSEIHMMNAMVSRMNAVLQRVALDTGTSFVGVEDSLVGGRICEGGEYVTGAWRNTIGVGGDTAMFHPNAEGHRKMADTIERSDVYGKTRIPTNSSYSPNPDAVQTFSAPMVSSGYAMRDQSLSLVAEPNTFAPNSSFTATIYSTPKFLGTFTAEADGSMRVRASVNGVSIGRHVLMVEGTGSSGSTKRLYQFIEVRAFKDDADGDGIKDKDDKCPFIVEWYDEKTGDNICIVSAANSNSEYETGQKYNKGDRAKNGSKDVRVASEEAVPGTRSDMQTSGVTRGTQDSAPMAAIEKEEAVNNANRASTTPTKNLEILVVMTGVVVAITIGIIIGRKFYGAHKTI